LATFTNALRGSIGQLRGSEEGLGVVSLVDGRHYRPRREVVRQLVQGDGTSMRRAVAALNSHEVVLVQHEYGIYGGPDGDEVLQLLSRLEVPAVVTLHTVLGNPTRRQRRILETIVEMAEQAIVMSDTGLDRLHKRYDVDPGKSRVIPHGARPAMSGPRHTRGARPVVLTWGLIGPGKGLESALEAFADLADLSPRPRYRILGQTHPKVQAAQGNTYRESLVSQARALGLEGIVEFDGRYLDVDSLGSAIRQADVVLLPYESTEQVTSGVLVEAVAAGKPVVATAFPHAVEMLSSGAGVVVPHSDSGALAGALRRLLVDPGLASRMAAMAAAIGSKLHWPAVAEAYEETLADLAAWSNPLAVSIA
jgi:glycosyltransferase involved in cell wall biosynthesis